MKIFKITLIIFFIINFNLLNAEEKDLQNKISKNLRCLICQGQSVYDSDSEFANSLKIAIKQKLKDGQSEKQIYDYLKIKTSSHTTTTRLQSVYSSELQWCLYFSGITMVNTVSCSSILL